MQRNEINLMGYYPYTLVNKFAGEWTPFNQTANGYVATLSLFKQQQNRYSLANLNTDGAACQGITLLYIENDCSMSALSNAVPELAKINPKSLAKAINYQVEYQGDEGARQALTTKGKCKKISYDDAPNKMNFKDLLNRIYAEVFKNGANTFYLTVKCVGHLGGSNAPYSGWHAYVIAGNEDQWKFFEANKGEVVFKKRQNETSKDTLVRMLQWLAEESEVGNLQEFTAMLPIVVREDGTTRKCVNYQVDIYKKDYTPTVTSENEKLQQLTRTYALR